MKRIVSCFILLMLAGVSQAQYEFVLDPAQLPAGHGQPEMTLCIQYQSGFQDCTDLEFVLDAETGLYHAVASLACVPAWLASLVTRMECHCDDLIMMYVFPPFVLPILCSPGNTVYPPLEPYFQYDTECTCPIADLAIRRDANQVRLQWSRANGQPEYHIRGFDRPYDPQETGRLLAITPDTTLVLPQGPDLSTFFRVTAVYPDPMMPRR
jgi:hypothetical protein